jgi:hypothetical protein
MTTPKVATVYQSGSRFYVHPETADRVPGVTSILNVLPKPALKPWAAKVVAETAVAQHDTINAMLIADDSHGAIDYLKRAPDRESNEARDFGTAAHSVLETLAYGDEVRWDSFPAKFRDRLKGVAANFAEFVAEFSPEFIMQEETVWSDTYGYAGSFDAICRIGDEVIVMDYKTNKSGVYGETALQLAAYRHADYILGADGSRVEMPEITGAAVLWIRDDMWKLHPVRSEEDIFATFVALREVVFPWESGGKRGVIGKAVNARSASGARRQRKAVTA